MLETFLSRSGLLSVGFGRAQARVNSSRCSGQDLRMLNQHETSLCRMSNSGSPVNPTCSASAVVVHPPGLRALVHAAICALKHLKWVGAIPRAWWPQVICGLTPVRASFQLFSMTRIRPPTRSALLHPAANRPLAIFCARARPMVVSMPRS